MGDYSKIQWTNSTWNPVTGCTHVSEGCRHCYAEHVVPRQRQKFSEVVTHPERLTHPIKWKKPRRIFVNSLSDLFHEDVELDFIDRVFAIMALTPQHTYQILTKRPKRMRQYMTQSEGFGRWGFIEGRAKQIHKAVTGTPIPPGKVLFGPLPHVWLGVSIEDQANAEERVPELLATPAAVRFVSCEPLLGPIDFTHDAEVGVLSWLKPVHLGTESCPALDWVIVGGESGPRARPMQLEWALSIVDQCQLAQVPVFVKQLGRFPGGVGRPFHDPKGGDIGEWPEYLRVREFPKGAS